MLPQHRLYARSTRQYDSPWSKRILKNSKEQNPGLDNQLGLRRELDADGRAFEDVDDYEADFTKLHHVHREHESEMIAQNERIQHLIVRNKYFKPTEKQNFLTWAEKEQIRNLHKTDPEQWSIERLAESFPATDEIIFKVIRNNWTPKNMKRVQDHDASVRNTWKSFEAGELKQLQSDFVEHLKKFSHRTFDSASTAYTNTANDQVKFEFPKPKTSEFFHLIKSMPRKHIKSVEIETDESVKKPILMNDQKTKQSIPPPTTGDTYVYGKIVGKNYTTFDQFDGKRRAKEAASKPQQPLQIQSTEKQTNVDNDEHLATVENTDNNELSETRENTLPSMEHAKQRSMLSELERHVAVKNPSGTGVVIDLNERINKFDVNKYVQKYNTRVVRVQEPDKYEIQMQEIKDHIYIPRKAYKRGAIFKVKDCFYDDDGEFLYRVPGLEG